MCIVTLKDGTTYHIDTDDTFKAHSVVDYKLRQRLDCRQIISKQVIGGCIMDKNSKTYNSSSQFDGKMLVCASGWSYKWD